MDILSFIANLVEHLATPVAALVALKILLSRAPQIGRFVKSVRYKDVEINLRDDFEKAKESAAAIELSKLQGDHNINSAPRLSMERNDKILQLASIDAGVAISEVWRQVEATVIQLMQHNGLMRFTRPDKLISWLASKDKISSAEVELFHRLRKIRNSVVHGGTDTPKISLAEVIEFKEFADLFIDRIEMIRAEPGYLDYPVPPTRSGEMG